VKNKSIAQLMEDTFPVMYMEEDVISRLARVPKLIHQPSFQQTTSLLYELPFFNFNEKEGKKSKKYKHRKHKSTRGK
jgi:hypothetical protein